MKMKSEQINELAAALAKAQGEMQTAKKDASNPFFKSKYADLSSVWEACREALTKHGLCVSQMIEQNENGDVLCTMLIHSSGQWLSSIIPIRVKEAKGGNELQALGSTLTYIRRYALSAIVGVAPDEDDDGNLSQTNYVSPTKTVTQTVAPRTNPAIISKEQVDLLNNILPQCSPEFRKSVDDFLSNNGIHGIVNLTPEQYKSVYENAKINAVMLKKNEAINGQEP